MTQRPKLSLSPPADTKKKQPAGFAVGAASPADREIGGKGTQPPPSVGARPAAAHSGANTQQPPWLNATTIAKTLLFVGAAALSILLLRRRFF